MMIFTEICQLFIPFWDHLIIFNGNKRFPSFIVGYAMCFIPGAVRIFAQGPLFRICQYFIMMTRKHLEYKGFRQSKYYLNFFFTFVKYLIIIFQLYMETMVQISVIRQKWQFYTQHFEKRIVTCGN